MDEKSLFFKNLNINESDINSLIDNMRIGIVIDKTMIHNYYGQIMLEVSVNLLARIYRNITISVPNISLNLQYNNKIINLPEYILDLARDSRRGNEEFIYNSDDLSDCTAILIIGANVDTNLSIPKVFISGNGWLAGVSLDEIYLGNIEDRNPTGSIAAACLGVAEIFKLTFRNNISKQVVTLSQPLVFSTLDYKNNGTNPINPRISRIDINNSVLFGAGSVGSAVAYCMKFLREVYGELSIVDSDGEIDYRNLLRYGYLTVNDIEKHRSTEKVKWLKEKIEEDCPNLKVNAIMGTVKDFQNAMEPYGKVQLAISAVDNVQARRDITDVLAKRTINAGTGDTRFTISRHGFADGSSCLYCLYLDVNNPPANNYQHYAQMIRLPISRIYELIEENLSLSNYDFDIMVENNILESNQREKVVGKPLQSFIHERFYGEVNIANSSNAKTVTVAFVSVMAGCLLFAEMLKETLNLTESWMGTMYEQDLLSLPNEMTQYRGQNSLGLCLCQNSFRNGVYFKKYPEMFEE